MADKTEQISNVKYKVIQRLLASHEDHMELVYEYDENVVPVVPKVGEKIYSIYTEKAYTVQDVQHQIRSMNNDRYAGHLHTITVTADL